MRKAAAAVACVVVLLPVGSARAQSATSEITQEAVVEMQWRDFRDFSRGERERGKAVDDATRTLGVDRIFARLLAVAWREFPRSRSLRWEVLLTDDEGLEARAYPSGQVVLAAPFVARFVQSEDELAFLLAHEMAHVLLEHARRGYEAAVPLTRLAGPVDARLIEENVKSSLPLQLRLLPLLRAQESEADRTGAQLAAAAGFEPSAGAVLLARMASLGDEHSPTHGSLQSRRAALIAVFVRE